MKTFPATTVNIFGRKIKGVYSSLLPRVARLYFRFVILLLPPPPPPPLLLLAPFHPDMYTNVKAAAVP